MNAGRLLLIALVAVPLAGCAVSFDDFDGATVVGTGAEKKDARTANGFNKIQIHRAIEATIVVDGTSSIVIEAKESLLPLVTTKVKGDSLVVETTKQIDSGSGKPRPKYVVRTAADWPPTASHLNRTLVSTRSRRALPPRSRSARSRIHRT